MQGEEGKCQGLRNSETLGSCWLHLDIGDVHVHVGSVCL